MKEYTRWLHWNITRFCNFNCEYCFSYSPYKKGEIISVDIDKIIKNLNDFDEIFRISFTGGEPFLVKNFIELCIKLSKKHFLSFNTNLTNSLINLFINEIEPEKVLKIDASFHYSQLLKKNLLGRYINNYALLKEYSFNVSSEQVAYPGLMNKIAEINKISGENNLNLKFVPFFGKYNEKIYPQSYTEEEISMFNLDLKMLNKFYQKGNFCNAGYNVGVAFSNGDIKPCFQIKDTISNIYENLEFNDSPVKECKSKICGCPMNVYDSDLFKIAKEKFI